MARRNESEEERAARKAATKAAKSEKRAERQGLGDPAKGRKPCTLCGRPRDLLIRCQVDATLSWHMACGKCWMAASGGEVDGAADRPYYRYGGLWKNHHRAVSGRSKVPAAAKAGAAAAAAAAGSGRRTDGGRKRHSRGEGREGKPELQGTIASGQVYGDASRPESSAEEDAGEGNEEEQIGEGQGSETRIVVVDGTASASASSSSSSSSSTHALLLAEAARCAAEDDAFGVGGR